MYSEVGRLWANWPVRTWASSVAGTLAGPLDHCDLFAVERIPLDRLRDGDAGDRENGEHKYGTGTEHHRPGPPATGSAIANGASGAKVGFGGGEFVRSFEVGIWRMVRTLVNGANESK